MSSIRITSQLHTTWHQTVRSLTNSFQERLTETDPPLTIAPRPSATPPLTEEMGDVMRTALKFLDHGVHSATISALVSSISSAFGTSQESLYPIQYLGGLGSFENTLISWPRNYIGHAVVCEEPFPIVAHYSPTGDTPNSIINFPESALRKVVLIGYDGAMLLPRKVIGDLSDIPEEDREMVHPTEATRTDSIVYLKQFYSGMRYTGCVRPATMDEIDTLFREVLVPDRGLKAHLNFCDYFNALNIGSRTISGAYENSTATSSSTHPTGGNGSLTNVSNPDLSAYTTIDEEITQRIARRAVPQPASPRTTRRFGSTITPIASQNRILYSSDSLPVSLTSSHFMSDPPITPPRTPANE